MGIEMKMNERNSQNSIGSDDPIIIVYGLVLRVDLNNLPKLKDRIVELGGQIIYQKVSGGRLIILEKED